MSYERLLRLNTLVKMNKIPKDVGASALPLF